MSDPKQGSECTFNERPKKPYSDPRFRKYLLLALALGDVKSAIDLASLPIDRQSWTTFDSAIFYRICQIIDVPQNAKLPRAKVTATEQVFLEALGLVAEKKQYDPSKVEAFWRSLRRKRYQLTIFEHFNAFNSALDTLGAV